MAMETVNAPQIIEHVKKNVTFTPYDTRWVPCSARFVAMGLFPKGTGCMQVYEMKLGELKLIKQIEKPKGFKCGTFGASSLEDRHIATGDYSGQLAIWDLERPEKAVFQVQAHKQIVNAIDGCGGLNIGGGAPELVTCSRDGTVRVWDPRVTDPVLSMEPAEGESARDCWTVAFGNSYNDAERCIAAGYDNGDVKLFDLRTNTMRWETNVGNGVVGLEFDRKDIEMNKLVVSTLESKFRVYNMRVKHPTKGYSFISEKAHKSTVWLARHLPQNRDVFMTAGGNGGLNIYRYKYPSSLTSKDEEGKLIGNMGSVELLNSRVLSSQPFVSFDWSPDKEGLAVGACLDQSLRVFITTKLNLY